tara:strand:- start:45 stop:839 length:795 start_codon:yes stop_codon:yes gene_type:complete
VKHVVFFSGGKASFGAAYRLRQEYNDDPIVLLFTDTKVEDLDLYRFLIQSAALIPGAQLVSLADGRTIWELFDEQSFLGNNRVPVCSRVLKNEVAQTWVRSQCDPDDTTLYFGIDYTEAHRTEGVSRRWEPYKVDFPLLWKPLWDKHTEVDKVLDEGRVEEPRLYKTGAEHNNCGGLCVRAGIGTFSRVYKNPDVKHIFTEWERQEEAMRSKLGKDVAILRDRAGGETVPLPLVELRKRIDAGTENQLAFGDDFGACGCMTEVD